MKIYPICRVGPFITEESDAYRTGCSDPGVAGMRVTSALHPTRGLSPLGNLADNGRQLTSTRGIVRRDNNQCRGPDEECRSDWGCRDHRECVSSATGPGKRLQSATVVPRVRFVSIISQEEAG